jgi:hypothetical protein
MAGVHTADGGEIRDQQEHGKDGMKQLTLQQKEQNERAAGTH